ncbi:MAG: thiosulfate oxidation carrier complex protein SoxZ [Marinibacterium sp.]
MASGVKPRVKVPKSASAGDSITIKTLISHKMESGQRKDKKTGELIPRSIIHRFVVDFNGTPVFEVAMEPSISTNPYFEFKAKATESGDFTFTWYDDDGDVYTASKSITVA